jgi:hypothetical protein
MIDGVVDHLGEHVVDDAGCTTWQRAELIELAFDLLVELAFVETRARASQPEARPLGDVTRTAAGSHREELALLDHLSKVAVNGLPREARRLHDVTTRDFTLPREKVGNGLARRAGTAFSLGHSERKRKHERENRQQWSA